MNASYVKISVARKNSTCAVSTLVTLTRMAVLSVPGLRAVCFLCLPILCFLVFKTVKSVSVSPSLCAWHLKWFDCNWCKTVCIVYHCIIHMATDLKIAVYVRVCVCVYFLYHMYTDCFPSWCTADEAISSWEMCNLSAEMVLWWFVTERKHLMDDSDRKQISQLLTPAPCWFHPGAGFWVWCTVMKITTQQNNTQLLARKTAMKGQMANH